MAKIVIRNLRKAFHDASRELVIIEDLSFAFPESQSVAIVGRSGIGKSTLLYLLAGLEEPSAGSIEYFGSTSITGLNDEELSHFRGANMGFVFQSHHLLPEFDARENVAMPLIIAGMPQVQALERAEAMLSRVGLGERCDHRPGQLSGGEQQRVAIARAIVAQPKIVLADEPTGNLDINTARQVQDLLISIGRELGIMLIVVTHNLELAKVLGQVFEMMPGGSLKPL